MKRHSGRVFQSGLSLLELLVALSIMALAVGVLYRALGSSVRSVGLLQQQQQAALLAHSLLAAKDAVAQEGWHESGESAGYVWEISSQPYETPVSRAEPGATRLHAVFITVGWSDGGQARHIELRTLRPQRRPIATPAAAEGA